MTNMLVIYENFFFVVWGFIIIMMILAIVCIESVANYLKIPYY